MQNKDKFYLNLAKQISSASYCKRAKVGAIIIKEDNIISFGYNGTISGFDNECECNNETKKDVLHAESNAIAKCSKSLYSSSGSTLYVTLSPCFECAKLIIQSGITKVVYLENYRDQSGINLLIKAKINVLQILL
jgi:dCMP deaminase